MSNIAFRKKAAKERRMREAGVIVKKDFSGIAFEPKEIVIEIGDQVARGQNIGIYLPEDLNSLYRRKNLCLKLFKDSIDHWGHARGVGISSILESTVVQNLMALRGLAPRVYDLVKINDRTAQVTDYLEGKEGVIPISDPRFHFDGNEIEFSENFIDGKLVDFQGCNFKNFGVYKEALIDKAKRGTTDRGSGGRAYQSSCHFEGFRDTEKRLKKLGFSEFKDKTVLDIGCSYGMFCQEAVKLGAKRVVGIDWPNVIKITQELAILDGFFNIDFYGIDIKSLSKTGLFLLTGIEKFNIHLFLAMENWVAWPAWVKNCDTLYYEGHGAVRPFWVKHFKEGKND